MKNCFYLILTLCLTILAKPVFAHADHSELATLAHLLTSIDHLLLILAGITLTVVIRKKLKLSKRALPRR